MGYSVKNIIDKLNLQTFISNFDNYKTLMTDIISYFCYKYRKKDFDKYLKDNGIMHKTSLPYRHKQLANVESLNKQLYYIFSAYMNEIEKETGEPYNEWNDILNDVKKELNKYRTIKKLPKYKEWINSMPIFNEKKAGEPKYKINDMVYYKLDYPRSALNNKQPTANFRVGDYRWNPVAKKIIKVLYMPDEPWYRYILDGIKNVSFSENELLKSNEKKQKFEIKKLLSSKIIKKKKYYLVWWKGFPKSQGSYVSETKLIEDLGQPFLNKLLADMK